MNAEPAGPTNGVVPIRPDAAINLERSRQLLDHVGQVLADYPAENGGEEPDGIAVFIIGMEGTGRIAWLFPEHWRANLAFAGAMMTSEAAREY